MENTTALKVTDMAAEQELSRAHSESTPDIAPLLCTTSPTETFAEIV